MMTAREQARKAGVAKAKDTGSNTAYIMGAAVGADAASDVWEPLLRELYEAYNLVGPIQNEAARELCQRAKEALGDAS